MAALRTAADFKFAIHSRKFSSLFSNTEIVQTTKRTMLGHQLYLCKLCKLDKVLTLLEVQGNYSDVVKYFRALQSLGAYRNPMTFVKFSNFTAALKTVQTRKAYMVLRLCNCFANFWKALSSAIKDLMRKISTKLQKFPPHVLNSWPKDFSLKVLDVAGAPFVVDQLLLSEYGGNIIEFLLALQDVQICYDGFGSDFPHYWEELIFTQQESVFPAAWDFMISDNRAISSRSNTLALTKQIRAVTSETNLVKQLREAGKRLDKRWKHAKGPSPFSLSKLGS